MTRSQSGYGLLRLLLARHAARTSLVSAPVSARLGLRMKNVVRRARQIPNEQRTLQQLSSLGWPALGCQQRPIARSQSIHGEADDSTSPTRVSSESSCKRMGTRRDVLSSSHMFVNSFVIIQPELEDFDKWRQFSSSPGQLGLYSSLITARTRVQKKETWTSFGVLH
jgi:hypothetical protein